MRGWITDSAASALLRQAGLDLAELRTRATRRDFRPVATGITMDIGFRNSVEHLRSAVAQDAQYSAAWKLLGKALAATGARDEAMQAYRSGIAAAERRGDKQAAKEMGVFLRRLEKEGG